MRFLLLQNVVRYGGTFKSVTKKKLLTNKCFAAENAGSSTTLHYTMSLGLSN